MERHTEDRWSSLQTQSFGKERTLHVSHILALESSETCGSASEAETRGAADGDYEVAYRVVSLKGVLFGQRDLQNWMTEARQILAALVVILLWFV